MNDKLSHTSLSLSNQMRFRGKVILVVGFFDMAFKFKFEKIQTTSYVASFRKIRSPKFFKLKLFE